MGNQSNDHIEKEDHPVAICEYWFRTEIGNDMSVNFISQLVKSYFPMSYNYRGKFVSANLGRGMLVDFDSDQSVKFFAESAGGAYKSAKLDTPIEIASNCVCSWQMSMNGQEGSLGGFDIFGVVSNECDNIGACAWGGLIDIYGISASRNVWKGTTHKFDK